MDRPAFNLMSYPVGPAGRTGHTFRRAVPFGRPAGTIVAPAGAKLWEGFGSALLKIPHPDRPGELLILDGAEALEKARLGQCGLEYRPQDGDAP